MLDIKKLQYIVYLLTESGKQLNITNGVFGLGWEENDGELAMRTSFQLKDIVFNGSPLSALAKPGCWVFVHQSYLGVNQEVARGQINEWLPRLQGSAQTTVSLVCYDNLFALQQSQDNRYYSSGTNIKTAISGIFNDWGVPAGAYAGPTCTIAKTLFKSERLSDILLQLLDTADKKNAGKYVIRSVSGIVYVVPRGSNSIIWHFGSDTNTTLVSDSVSITDLVTRVRIVGKEDSEGRQKVEATVDGLIAYGIRQQIYSRDEDDTAAAAKTAAQEILKEKGVPARIRTIEGPDIPTIRRGDKIHAETGTLSGYYYVKSVRHNADDRIMSIDVDAIETVTATTASAATGTEFNKGDRIILNGAVYRDSYGNGKGRTFTNRTGTITIKVSTSRACPYHIDGIGWVYPSSITKA